jgi:hypothetical protein
MEFLTEAVNNNWAQLIWRLLTIANEAEIATASPRLSESSSNYIKENGNSWHNHC